MKVRRKIKNKSVVQTKKTTCELTKKLLQIKVCKFWITIKEYEIERWTNF